MLKAKICQQDKIIIARVDETQKRARWITQELTAAHVKHNITKWGPEITIDLTGKNATIDVTDTAVYFQGERYVVNEKINLDIFFDEVARFVVESLNKQGG